MQTHDHSLLTRHRLLKSNRKADRLAQIAFPFPGEHLWLRSFGPLPHNCIPVQPVHTGTHLRLSPLVIPPSLTDTFSWRRMPFPGTSDQARSSGPTRSSSDTVQLPDRNSRLMHALLS